MNWLALLSRNLVGDAVALEDAANAAVKEPTLRRSVEELLVHVERNVEVVVDGSRRELDLQDASCRVVAGRRDHRRPQPYAGHRRPPRAEMACRGSGRFGPAGW